MGMITMVDDDEEHEPKRGGVFFSSTNKTKLLG